MTSFGKLALALAAVLITTQSSADWWSNGGSVTHTGIGHGGNDISSYGADALTNVFGLDASYASSTGQPSLLADDYTPNNPEVVRHLRIRWFQTAVSQPTLSRVHVKVYDGDPRSGGILIYNRADPTMVVSSGGYLSPFTGNDVYRTSASNGIAAINSQRRILEVTVRLDGGIALATGRTYYIGWSIESLTGAEVLCPTLPWRGNGLQESLSGGLRQWREALGNPANAASDVDMPFDLFLSTNAAQSDVFPTSAASVSGLLLSGSVADLAESDDRNMIWFDGPGQVCQVQLAGVSPVLSVQRLVFNTELSALRAGLSVETLLYNFNTGRWTTFGFICPTEDTNLRSEVILNASQYISGSRAVRSQIRWQPVNDDEPSQDGWLHSLDRCCWSVIPQ